MSGSGGPQIRIFVSRDNARLWERLVSASLADGLIDETITAIHRGDHGTGVFKIDAWHENQHGIFTGWHFSTPEGGITPTP